MGIVKWIRQWFVKCEHAYEVIDEVHLPNYKDSLRLLKCDKCDAECGVIVTRNSVFSCIRKIEVISESAEWVKKKIENLRQLQPLYEELYEPGKGPAEE